MVQYEKNKTRLVRLLTSLGDVQMEQGNYAEAVKYYEKILVLGIEEPLVYSALSKAFQKLKRYDTQALNIYRKTLQFEPHNKEICNLLSQYYLKMNRRDEEAISVYTRALNLKSVHAVEILPTLIQIHLERNEISSAIGIAQKGIDLPEVREEALKFFVQLSIRGQQFDHALNILKRLYKRTRQLPLLQALCRLLVEKHANQTQAGEMYYLSEEDCELALKFLKVDFHLQKFEEVQFFNALCYVITASIHYRRQHQDERSSEYEFFFSNVDPLVVLKRGFDGNASAEEREINFFSLIWNRMNPQLHLSSDAESKGLTKPPEFTPKRPLLGLAFRITNYRQLISQHGARKTGSNLIHLLNQLTNSVLVPDNFHLRFLADGLVALVPFHPRFIQSVISLLRQTEQLQQKTPSDEKYSILVSLHLIQHELVSNGTFFKDFNILLQLSVLPFEKLTSSKSKTEAKIENENRLLISRTIFLRLREMEHVEIHALGDFNIRHLLDRQQVYQFEWADPFDVFKTNVLKNAGRFEILNELLQKNSYSVYQGRDSMLERMVFIKVIREKSTPGAEDRTLTTQFLQEAREMGRLNHRNIMLVYDVAQTNGFVYLAREYFEGQNLTTLLKEGRLKDINRLIRIFVQIASALKHAHQMKIYHKNLKPSNIIVAENDEVKITDFGNACYLLKMKDDETNFLSDLIYRAPEQVTDQPVDERTDIFSLGSILYEALTGQPAFQAANVEQIKAKILNDTPPLPSELGLAVPSSFDSILRKAIAKNPDDRFDKIIDMMRPFYATTTNKQLHKAR